MALPNGSLYNLALADQQSGQLYQPNGGSWFDQNGFSGSAPFTNGQVTGPGASPTQLIDPSQLPSYAGTNTAGSTGGIGSPSLSPAMGGPQNGDYQSWFMQLTNGKPPTPQTLQSLAPQLQQYGISLVPNAEGVPGKIKLPDGSIVDVIQGAGVGGQAWQWLGPGGSGSSGGTGTFGSGGFGSGTFTPPSLSDLQNSPLYPGFQFGQQQANQAIERSAAARGDLLTGGTLKALANYNIGAGNQYAQNVFNNALQTHQTNVGDLYNLASLGKPS